MAKILGDDVLPIDPPEWNVLQWRMELRGGKPHTFKEDTNGWVEERGTRLVESSIASRGLQGNIL